MVGQYPSGIGLPCPNAPGIRQMPEEKQAAAAAANTPLRSFPEEPDMLVKNGRYGAYIAYKGKNYRLPKGSKPEELTLDDCLKIVADSKK